MNLIDADKLMEDIIKKCGRLKEKVKKERMTEKCLNVKSSDKNEKDT